jgi:hypothetical protein
VFEPFKEEKSFLHKTGVELGIFGCPAHSLVAVLTELSRPHYDYSWFSICAVISFHTLLGNGVKSMQKERAWHG